MNNFTKFQLLPLKARYIWVQENLKLLGYLSQTYNITGKRDKPYIKAVKAFQMESGLTSNGQINLCEYSLIISKIDQLKEVH